MIADDMELERYLMFTLGGELYATPLMSVREVVETTKPKPIPHTVPSFLGVMNIRGEIVGVLDLRVRLGYHPAGNPNEAMMVFEISGGAIAALVDSMEGVTRIPPDSIDTSPSIESRLPLHFLLGVGRIKDKLVTIIDVSKVLEKEEVRTVIQTTKLSA